eukprot:TRINITY_DN4377_c0_g1_i3.p1 TRINITY_DN4377_c0_g1~~TRINITY_DN4377_c0_g1_i3.p1  ORF type:complete len:674 (-),score=176.71 TRINITY_DN4377_c0_g1_i3:88-2013(-)
MLRSLVGSEMCIRDRCSAMGCVKSKHPSPAEEAERETAPSPIVLKICSHSLPIPMGCVAEVSAEQTVLELVSTLTQLHGPLDGCQVKQAVFAQEVLPLEATLRSQGIADGAVVWLEALATVSAEEKARLLLLMKACQNAGRYQEMVALIEKAAAIELVLDPEIVQDAYKGGVRELRCAWKAIAAMADTPGRSEEREVLEEYLCQIQGEMGQLIESADLLVQRQLNLGPNQLGTGTSLTTLEQVELIKLQADCCRYGAECSKGELRQRYAARACAHYSHGAEEAESLHPCSYQRLSVGVNHSVFLAKVMGELEAAAAVAHNCLQPALAQPRPSSQTSSSPAHHHPSKLLKILQENILLWSQQATLSSPSTSIRLFPTSWGSLDILLAKASQAADRFDDMVQHVAKFKPDGGKLNEEERELVQDAYQGVLRARRSSWRGVLPLAKQHGRASWEREVLEEYLGQIQGEMGQLIESADLLVQRQLNLGPNQLGTGTSLTTLEQVLWFKVQADCCRYGVECSQGALKHQYTKRAQDWYDLAMEAARGSCPASSWQRLSVAVNYSVFQADLDQLSEATFIARTAFEDAMRHESENTSSEAANLMNVLRDNLLMWNDFVDRTTFPSVTEIDVSPVSYTHLTLPTKRIV